MAVQKVEIEANILDPETCKHCGLMEITNYPEEICANGEVVVICNHYKCRHVKQCEYIRNHLAKETIPNMEE